MINWFAAEQCKDGQSNRHTGDCSDVDIPVVRSSTSAHLAILRWVDTNHGYVVSLILKKALSSVSPILFWCQECFNCPITCVFFDRIHLLADPIGLATEKGLGSLVETNGVSICFTATSMRHNGNYSEGSSLSSTRAFRVTVTETHKRDHDGDHDGRAILLFHVEDGC